MTTKTGRGFQRKATAYKRLCWKAMRAGDYEGAARYARLATARRRQAHRIELSAVAAREQRAVEAEMRAAVTT